MSGWREWYEVMGPILTRSTEDWSHELAELSALYSDARLEAAALASKVDLLLAEQRKKDRVRRFGAILRAGERAQRNGGDEAA